ncbi:ParB/RepB/Spo0J family partition protein [Kitasatospora sp. NPDC092948]|uniref:ParB/RepB/Spo0J family partition protein n=1 Tax=Kitasatospora sp. NPDC092948 TaxID=3364088 RepID=UPI00381D6467
MSATMIENPTVDQEQEADQEPQAVAETEEGLTHAIGDLEWHFPEDLVLDEYNHRKQIDTEPDATLKASVRESGVQEPVGARPQADGKIGIFKGQRRWKAQLLANKEAKRKGLPLRKVPVLVRRDLTEVDDETLVLSIIENTQRAQASQRDVADGLTQLALLEVAPSTLAKHGRRLGYKPAEIKAAKNAAQLDSDTLGKYGQSHGWNFVQLADLAEVKELGWDAERALMDAHRKDENAKRDKKGGPATSGHWEQAMARLRLDLADLHKRKELLAELETAGVPVVRYARWDRDSKVRPLSHLVTPAGKKITVKAHAELCSDHAAFIDSDKIRVVYACRDWAANSHSLNPEQAAQLPEKEDKEASKAARKRVIEGNKAWRAAREARRKFLVQLINPGKGGPKEISDAAWSWVMRAMTGNTYWFPRFYGSSRRLGLLAELLKTEVPKHTGQRDMDPFAHVTKRRGRPGRPFLLLAQVAAAFEHEQMHDAVWKSPSAEVAQWLRFLAAEGYTLAACEQAVIDQIDAAREAAEAKAKQSTEEDQEELDAALRNAAAESGVELLDGESPEGDDDQADPAEHQPQENAAVADQPEETKPEETKPEEEQTAREISAEDPSAAEPQGQTEDAAPADAAAESGVELLNDEAPEGDDDQADPAEHQPQENAAVADQPEGMSLAA